MRDFIAASIFAVALPFTFVQQTHAATPAKDVLVTYANIAEAMYGDALTTAKALQAAVDALLAAPSDDTLAKARTAWLAARVPYQQTEGFRFGNALVDDWEGKVNAWPLDEGLIDYVDASYGDSSDENPLYTANIIANPRLKVGKTRIDARKITKVLLSETLQEAGGVESNVATGYHAVEFLLWGQDLNGTSPGAGARKASDYDLKACTNGNCDRRRAYLKAATALLVDDLAEMAQMWSVKGKARAAVLKKPEKEGLATILTGIGSLSYGELAGERTKLGLILHDPEEEHDCFSDNTHNSHYYNQVGMVAIVEGAYRRIDGSWVQGPSVLDLAREAAPTEAQKLGNAMTNTLGKAAVMKRRPRAAWLMIR